MGYLGSNFDQSVFIEICLFCSVLASLNIQKPPKVEHMHSSVSYFSLLMEVYFYTREDFSYLIVFLFFNLVL